MDEARCLRDPPTRVETGREVGLTAKRPLEVQPMLHARAFGANALFQ